MQLGIAGELRCVVTKADGTVKQDTGYQRNLILNQGLDFFGGSKGSNINDYCAIGSGNSAPVFNQTALDAVVAVTAGVDTTSNYAYSDQGDNLYRIWEQKKYRFTNLDNVNVSEVGLVSTGTTSENYYLTTRALIKDSAGAPTSISIITGETLDIYYKIHKVIDTSDKDYVVNMLDGNGDSTPYNVVVRPAYVGGFYGENPLHSVVKAAKKIYEAGFLGVTDHDLGDYTSGPTGGGSLETYAFTAGSYTVGTFKLPLQIQLELNKGNKNIRCVFTPGNSTASYWFHPFQIRFGSVADDSPIPKTNKQTLTIPLEVSWGRYEGDL